LGNTHKPNFSFMREAFPLKRRPLDEIHQRKLFVIVKMINILNLGQKKRLIHPIF